jgi:predicted Rossmann fold flavoprotein
MRNIGSHTGNVQPGDTQSHAAPDGENTFDLVIVGGGAAGLMCAQHAGHLGLRVLLIEHANRVGKKILMSGGGRCNFTNLGTTPANFLSENPHFCKSALSKYRPAHFVALIEKHGIQYHEKELGQLFCDESSKLVVKMLSDECRDAGVETRLSTSVAAIAATEYGFTLRTTCLTTPAREVAHIHCAQLVIATGGLSIPAMGATGFGYDIARQFGHRVITTRAGLVPLTLSGSYSEAFSELSGLALPIAASVGKTCFENAMLITHRGLSGPAILQISSYWQPGVALGLNLVPGHSPQALQQSLSDAGHLSLLDWLGTLLPKRFAQRFAAVYGGALTAKKLAECGKAAWQRIAEQLTCWPIQPSGTEGYRTAEVTLGGVDTREIDSSSMASKRQAGLYFIGEVLDVTGHLGGYNFQWAWASGVAAAAAAQRAKERTLIAPADPEAEREKIDKSNNAASLHGA